MPRPSPRLRTWVGCAVLLVAALLLYRGTLDSPFTFDDVSSIVQDPQIRSLWPPHEALRASPGSNAHGRPLVALSLALNHAAGGVDPWGYRLVNVLLHGLVGCMLFLLLAGVLTDRPGPGSPRLWAFAVALTWTVHPLASDAVNLVVSRNEQLLALAYLATLYAAVRTMEPGGSAGWTLAACAACALGMASKEAMVSAPLAVLLFDRCFAAGSFGRALRARPGLYSGLAASWALLVFLVLTADRGDSVGLDLRVAPLRYGLEQGWAVLHYLRLCFWPDPLIFDYGSWHAFRGAPTTQVETAVVLLLCLAGLVALARCRPEGFLACLFFAVLAPSSSLIPLTGEVVAEHRMYLPLAVVSTGTVLALRELVRRTGQRRLRMRRNWLSLHLLAWLAIDAALARSTLLRNRDYSSVLSIWEDTVRKRPINDRAYLVLGPEYAERGRLDDAIRAWERALKLVPAHVEARIQLAFTLDAVGRRGEADFHLREALRLAPAKPAEAFAASLAALARGDWRAAMVGLERVLWMDPDHAGARAKLALLYCGAPDARARRPAEALQLARSLVDGVPAPRAEALDALAAALAERGDFEQARRTALRARELASARGLVQLADEIGARLEHYERDEPFRLESP